MTALTPEQRRRFDEKGLVRLESFIDRAAAEAMADTLWEEMARRHGMHRDDRATWQAERPAQFGAFQRTGAFNAMATEELRAVLDELIGEAAWTEPRGWGLPLVCFPTGAQTWALPHKIWHLDLTPDPRRRGPLVGRIFVLLAPLRPQGGGTLVATGSHRIVEALAERHGALMSSADMRKRLAREHAWFADLMAPPREGEDRIARFMGAPTLAGDVPLQIEEITGHPGDVFLMHPHTLHGLSPNTLDQPRLALTQSVYPRGWMGP